MSGFVSYEDYQWLMSRWGGDVSAFYADLRQLGNSRGVWFVELLGADLKMNLFSLVYEDGSQSFVSLEEMGPDVRLLVMDVPAEFVLWEEVGEFNLNALSDLRRFNAVLGDGVLVVKGVSDDGVSVSKLQVPSGSGVRWELVVP